MICLSKTYKFKDWSKGCIVTLTLHLYNNQTFGTETLRIGAKSRTWMYEHWTLEIQEAMWALL